MSQERILRNTLNSAISRLPAGGAPGLATLRDNLGSPMFRGVPGKRMALALLEQAKNNRRRVPSAVFASARVGVTEFAQHEKEQPRRSYALRGLGIGLLGGGILGGFAGRGAGRFAARQTIAEKHGIHPDAMAHIPVIGKGLHAEAQAYVRDAGQIAAVPGAVLGGVGGGLAGLTTGALIRRDPEQQRRNFSSNMNTTARLISLNARLDREVAFASRQQDEESHVGRNIAIGTAAAAGLGGAALVGRSLGNRISKYGLKSTLGDITSGSLSPWGMAKHGAGLLRNDYRGLTNKAALRAEQMAAVKAGVRGRHQAGATIRNTAAAMEGFTPAAPSAGLGVGGPAAVAPDLDAQMAQYKAFKNRGR